MVFLSTVSYVVCAIYGFESLSASLDLNRVLLAADFFQASTPCIITNIMKHSSIIDSIFLRRLTARFFENSDY